MFIKAKEYHLHDPLKTVWLLAQFNPPSSEWGFQNRKKCLNESYHMNSIFEPPGEYNG